MGLFTPGWKSGNTQTACRAIAKLKDGAQKKAIIREILKTDPRQEVQTAALASMKRDPEFLKEIYESFPDDAIRSQVFCCLSDNNYKKEALLKSEHPRYWMMSYLQGEKEFAYDLLAGQKPVGTPDQRFWYETLRIIHETYEEEDKEKLLKIVRTSDAQEIIENICRVLNMHREKDALIELAGRGRIGPKRFFNGSKVTWTNEDYIKKCARDLLIKDGYTDEAWNEPSKKG